MARTKKDDDPTDDAPTVEEAPAAQAQHAREEQLLDMVSDLMNKVEALEAAQTGPSAVVVKQNDQQKKFDDELDALKAEFADYPAIEMFERRVVLGVDADDGIRLKDEPSVVEDPYGQRRKWKLRWFNHGKPGRAYQAAQEGYEQVALADLRDPGVLSVEDAKDRYVRRGERGQEALYRIPLKMFDYKKRRDAARRQGQLQSESWLRGHMANATAVSAEKSGGSADQAGTFIDKNLNLEITRGQPERVTF